MGKPNRPPYDADMSQSGQRDGQQSRHHERDYPYESYPNQMANRHDPPTGYGGHMQYGAGPRKQSNFSSRITAGPETDESTQHRRYNKPYEYGGNKGYGGRDVHPSSHRVGGHPGGYGDSRDRPYNKHYRRGPPH